MYKDWVGGVCVTRLRAGVRMMEGRERKPAKRDELRSLPRLSSKGVTERVGETQREEEISVNPHPASQGRSGQEKVRKECEESWENLSS